MNIVGIQGSPSLRSRSGCLLQLAQSRLQAAAGSVPGRSQTLTLREFPAEALLHAQFGHPLIRDALAAVARADLVLVATPIYKAAYSGLLKTFLDLLPQDALRGKTVLPLATGGSAAHLLAIDYALKPVLAALGARDILDAVYATDAQILGHGSANDPHGYTPAVELQERVDAALRPLFEPADIDPLAPLGRGWGEGRREAYRRFAGPHPRPLPRGEGVHAASA